MKLCAGRDDGVGCQEKSQRDEKMMPPSEASMVAAATHLSRKTISNLGAFGLFSKLSRIMSSAILPFSAVLT